MKSDKTYTEWYFQADYDLEVAEDMLKSGRYVYCIFMCHLCLEKGLKGLFNKRTGEYPPKSHNLLYFVERIGLVLTEGDQEFLFALNKISVPTRYPENLKDLINEFNQVDTEIILNTSRNTLQWIKQQ
ncbi:MAG: HEPN domain-containing protein [Bacteroidales bacterium]|nr:HEPN domain-containing protein [Bacteroidales bacterium]